MLQIVLPSAEYYVQALSDAEAQEWLEALEVNARSHTCTYLHPVRVLTWVTCMCTVHVSAASAPMGLSSGTICKLTRVCMNACVHVCCVHVHVCVSECVAADLCVLNTCVRRLPRRMPWTAQQSSRRCQMPEHGF